MSSSEKIKRGKTDICRERKASNTEVPMSIYHKGDKFYITIYAKPNAKVSKIKSELKGLLTKLKASHSGISEENVEVNIAAAPKDGEANNELIEFMSTVL